MIEPAMVEPTKLEIDEYIATVLGEYVAKSLIWETPTWFWGSGWPLAYYPSLKKIFIPDLIADFWIVDKETTKLALRYPLGHEFAHFLQDIRHSPVMTFPWIADRLAERQAVKLSGISTSHAMQLWQQLFHELEVMERKVVVKAGFSEKRFYVRYIDLKTGRTEEDTISEKEQFDLYKRQRAGEISIIEIHTIE